MQDRQFDELARALGNATTPRRRMLHAFLAGAVALTATELESEALAKRRRQRRRRRGRDVRVCFKDREIVVNRTAARELVSRGAQRGRCGRPGEPPGGTETCQGATLHCDANPTSCGGANSECICTLTTTGASVCAADQVVCDAEESTCTAEADCVARFGTGFVCVSTTGCSGLFCGGNGNACAPPCATCIPAGRVCDAGVSGSCCGGVSCADGVCGGETPGPSQCGTAGQTCPPCQTCVEGVCEALPNGTFACDGSFLDPQNECTRRSGTGVCRNGGCACGTGGQYDRATNSCACNELTGGPCASQGRCCQVTQVCDGGSTSARCRTCTAN